MVYIDLCYDGSLKQCCSVETSAGVIVSLVVRPHDFESHIGPVCSPWHIYSAEDMWGRHYFQVALELFDGLVSVPALCPCLGSSQTQCCTRCHWCLIKCDAASPPPFFTSWTIWTCFGGHATDVPDLFKFINVFSYVAVMDVAHDIYLLLSLNDDYFKNDLFSIYDGLILNEHHLWFQILLCFVTQTLW